MGAILIILAVSAVSSVLIVLTLFRIGKHADPGTEQIQDNDSRYYDENGNHIYYDRRLIAHLKERQEREAEKK